MITIYELLGMVKDGKAPKKIKYDNIIFEYDGIYYMAEHNTYLDEYCDLSRVLNEEVEIIEEKKKIPEKLEILPDNEYYSNKVLYGKINEIIDCLKSIEEIPQFEGTLEQLDNLCNIKSKGE